MHVFLKLVKNQKPVSKGIIKLISTNYLKHKCRVLTKKKTKCEYKRHTRKYITLKVFVLNNEAAANLYRQPFWLNERYDNVIAVPFYYKVCVANLKE